MTEYQRTDTLTFAARFSENSRRATNFNLLFSLLI